MGKNILLPRPQNFEFMDGFFRLRENTVLIPGEPLICKQWLMDLEKYIENETGILVQVGTASVQDGNLIRLDLTEHGSESKEAYELKIDDHSIVLRGQKEGIYYGLKTLRQLITRYKNKLPAMKIKDEPAFPNRGWMIDITRGRVPKLEYLMEIVDIASDFKINMLQLYIEHTFMFDFTSEINLGKDGLRAEDILILDHYCKEHMIQLVPCIATFGHLFEILKSDSYKHLCEYEDFPNEPYDWMKRQLHHTLDCNNPESYEFVKKILEHFVPLFSSPIVNICGDETFDIGRGKNKEFVKEAGAARLYVDFIKKVMAMIKSMGKKVMFFGDMIIEHPEYLKELPEDIICMNWNYEPDVTRDATAIFHKARVKQYVCPGTLGWNRALNDYKGAFLNITRLIQYGQEYKADGVLITEWGDFGNINLLSTSLPGLILGAVMAWNPYEEDTLTLEEYNKEVISLLGFDGMEDLNPLPLLAEISDNMYITWEHLMKWYFHVSFGNVSYGSTHEFIEDTEYAFYKETMAKLDTLIEELEDDRSKAYHRLSDSRQQDFKEAVHMAKVARLWQHVGYMIKTFYFDKDHYNLKNEKLRKEALDLAVQLEKWQMRYEELWRVRNRESELYRIREVISGLCHYLREPGIYKDQEESFQGQINQRDYRIL